MKPPPLLPCALLLVSAVSGCRSPKASATASPRDSESGLANYRVSGVVTDEGGSPIPLASVVVDQGPSLAAANAENRWVTASTSHDGRFELVLNTDQWHNGPNRFGLLRAWTENDEFRGNTHRLDWQGTNTVKHVRLRRIRMIEAGQSIEVAVEQDSPLCESGGLSLETICEWVRVRYPRDGTLTVEAHGESGNVPTVRSWLVAGRGIVSFPVSIDRSDCAEIAIAIPVGSPPQRFWVSTSLQLSGAARN
jgi:hypothetical protein